MRPVVTLGLGIAFGLVLVTAAHADGRVAVLDDPALPSGPPGTTPTISARAVDPLVVDPAPLDSLAANDAMSDRSFGRSTAIGLAPAHFDLSMRTAIEHGSMWSVAAGLTNSVELSADAGYARHVADDYGIGVKLTLVRHATYALAVDVSVHSTSEASIRTTMGSADLKLTTCALDGNLLFTAGVGFTTSYSDYDNQTTPTIELSMIFGRGVVRPLVETLVFAGDSSETLAFGGLRIGGRHVGVDLGVGLIGTSFTEQSSFGMLVGLGVRP
ncbi:MAG: hypothetical protein ABI591_02285 [Kofleriaceae bacterium]